MNLREVFSHFFFKFAEKKKSTHVQKHEWNNFISTFSTHVPGLAWKLMTHHLAKVFSEISWDSCGHVHGLNPPVQT